TKYITNHGLLLKQDKNDRVRRVIKRWELEPLLYMLHDHPISAHFGIERTVAKAKKKYYWPKMKEDIEIYIKFCDQCQRRNKPLNKNELHPIEVQEPFYQIGIDFVGPLPITKNDNKYIIVAIDYFTKWPEAKAVPEATAKETSKFIFEDIVCKHGCPQKILSDRGSHFNNQVIQELMTKLNIKHLFSTPYHPKTNGLVERFNKTLCESLAKLQVSNNWDELISSVLFAYRNNNQKSTQMKPFLLVYGRDVRTIFDDKDEGLNIDRIEEIIDKIPNYRYEAKMNIKDSQQKQKQYHDKNITKQDRYQIGDKVLYYNAAKEKQWSGKLEEKWKGPYYINETLPNDAYKLKEMNGRILKVPVNGELLKRYYSRENFDVFVVV